MPPAETVLILNSFSYTLEKPCYWKARAQHPPVSEPSPRLCTNIHQSLKMGRSTRQPAKKNGCGFSPVTRHSTEKSSACAALSKAWKMSSAQKSLLHGDRESIAIRSTEKTDSIVVRICTKLSAQTNAICSLSAQAVALSFNDGRMLHRSQRSPQVAGGERARCWQSHLPLASQPYPLLRLSARSE